MRIAFALFALMHGAIHLMGCASAFGWTEKLPIKRPPSKAWGIAWLVAALLWGATATLVLVTSRHWWLPALLAVLVSQAAIVKSFADAKWGTLANVIALVPIAVALLGYRATSLTSTYERERAAASVHAPERALAENELARLPAQVQAYMRLSGSVGKPRVRAFRARMRGELRSALDAPWMHVDIMQENTYQPSTRLFLARGTRFGLPFDALHRYVGESATMRVHLASLFEVVNAHGREMNQSETVTLFNDMCLFAPATLIDPAIEWSVIDARSVRARFRRSSVSIQADLFFNERGELINFISDDRFQSADGKAYVRYRWSTPVEAYGELRGRHLVTRARAQWRMHGEEFPYARFELIDIEYNPTIP